MNGSTSPETKEELRKSFDISVRSAHENGVKIKGSYVLRHTDIPDWEIQITELVDE